MTDYTIDEISDSYPIGVIPRQHPLAEAILADFPGASLVIGDTSGKRGSDTEVTLLYATDAAQNAFTEFSDAAKIQAWNSWERGVFNAFWVQWPGLAERWAARIEESG